MAVLVGKKAPDFTASAVINGEEIVEDFKLSDYAGKYVIGRRGRCRRTWGEPRARFYSAFPSRARAFIQHSVAIVVNPREGAWCGLRVEGRKYQLS